jgi:hypothetical protein
MNPILDFPYFFGPLLAFFVACCIYCYFFEK